VKDNVTAAGGLAAFGRSRRRFLWAALSGLLGLAGCRASRPRVVLYCAQDHQEFAEDVLADFTGRTGIEVAPKFDTEADKSVSLYVELIQEKDRPRCDVFWNNEILSTLRLQRQGLLEPYASPPGKPLPHAADHTWHAFAARARVLIVNTRLVPEAQRPRGLLDLADPVWKGRAVMARPQFGTSATQAACLFEVLGRDEAERYYRGLRANDVIVAPGNKQVAEWVALGQAPGGRPAAVGVTDTDDAIDEVQAGRPVAIIFPDRDRPRGERMGTLFIPNTVAILRGGPNGDGARQLVDFLLSPEVEAKLAESDAHQIPLHPEVRATLPAEIETPRTVKAMDVDFDKAAALWDEVQTFLSREFARP
jgi:iron(III) transport system substrate-binding protein